jgi:hypothetical protein
MSLMSKGYNCDLETYQCSSEPIPGGLFATRTGCSHYCQKPPMRYTCDTENWVCVEDSNNGVYASLSSCQPDCTNKCECKKCPSSGSCVKQCSTNTDCNLLPPEEDIYGCTDPAADNYNPEATIDDESCIYEDDEEEEPPRCQIFNFHVPHHAWIGYDSLAEWTTNNICTWAEITCKLDDGSDCGDKENLSGEVPVGFDQEQRFRIFDVGIYQYQLKACVDKNQEETCVIWEDVLGTGLDYVQIQALNLPIWQEINPVLP